jgi:hypothetical protein
VKATHDVKSFSQREGLKPIRSEFQIDDIDAALRNALWNNLIHHFWSNIKPDDFHLAGHPLIEKLWADYFKQRIDSIHRSWGDAYKTISEYFFDCPWYGVYDLLEYLSDYDYYGAMHAKTFAGDCNLVLERELSAYRFVGGKITRITSKEEIAEIEAALDQPLGPVRTHLETALGHLADRKAPDYRNSIKESISAVEALCRLITGDQNATLGGALGRVRNAVKLHPALEGAFDKLYGYTSSAEGIRHALLDETSLDFEDAKFMFVSCSAFVNYLVSKSSKVGMKLG